MSSTFRNKQFVYYLLATVPLWTVAAFAVQAAGLSVFWAFVAGTLVATALDPVANWFLDWRDLSEELSDSPYNSTGQEDA